MSKWRQVVLATALAVFPQGLSAQSGVAVVGFVTEGSVGLGRGEYPTLGLALTATLAAELAARAAQVVTLDPAGPDRQGHFDLGAARAQAGRLGARWLAVGQLLDQYGDIHLEVRLIDVASGEPVSVIRADEAHHSRDVLAMALGSIADQLTRQPAIGGRPAAATAVSVEALMQFGRGLELEIAGDAPGAAAAYRKAAALAPGFSALERARRRVGG